jgi:2'-5' RNA ligase
MDFINSYAIVAYVAGPIARFADRLRNDLVPGTGHHAHITVLPPRPLFWTIPDATEFAARLVAQFEPFEVGIGEVQVFEDTEVIYLSIEQGTAELVTMHDVLNTGPFGQQEQFDYVPHLTLGQQLAPGTMGPSVELARHRWAEFGPPPPFRIETLTLVQQRADGSWHDLAELALGRVPAVGSPAV